MAGPASTSRRYGRCRRSSSAARIRSVRISKRAGSDSACPISSPARTTCPRCPKSSAACKPGRASRGCSARTSRTWIQIITVSSRVSLRRVQLHSLTDECPQRRFTHHVPLTEINGAHGGAVEPGVEHVLLVLQQRALRERQPYRALECLTDADVPIARPNGHAHRPGRLLPFHLLDDGCVGAEDHRSQSGERRAPPVAGCLDDGVDVARRRRILAWTARARCHPRLTPNGPQGSLISYVRWIIADRSAC